MKDMNICAILCMFLLAARVHNLLASSSAIAF